MKKLLMVLCVCCILTELFAGTSLLYKPVIQRYGHTYINRKFDIKPAELGFEQKEFFNAKECAEIVKKVIDVEQEFIKTKQEKWNKGNRFADNIIYSDTLTIGFCIPQDTSIIKFNPPKEGVTVANIYDYPMFTDENIKGHKEVKNKQNLYRFVYIYWEYDTTPEYEDSDISYLGFVVKPYYTKKECKKIIDKYIEFQTNAKEYFAEESIPFHKVSDNVYNVMGLLSSVHCYPVDENKLTYDPVKEIPLDESGRIVDYPVFLDEPRPMYKTSFACNPKKWTVTERLICTNEVLADLDIELSEVYKKALKEAASAEEKENIRTAQREWVEEQSSMINSIELKKMYVNRIEELSGE